MGHLAGLADADSYDPKYAKWRYDDLPILPEHWQMVVGKDKKKQFDILKKLMNAPDVTEVVNACDAGREGEMIFRLSLIHIYGTELPPFPAGAGLSGVSHHRLRGNLCCAGAEPVSYTHLDWGYTVSSEKGKISDINKNSFIYIATKDERDDTIKIQLSDYENGISYEYTIPLIFAGNNEHSLDKFKENLSDYLIVSQESID